MAKDSKVPEKYGEVVQKLEEVVRRLEGGELSLEDSLKDFEEGIRLVRRGESLLTEAERRIEQLLADGSRERLEPAASGAGSVPVVSSTDAGARKNGEQPEDIPF